MRQRKSNLGVRRFYRGKVTENGWMDKAFELSKERSQFVCTKHKTFFKSIRMEKNLRDYFLLGVSL